MSGEYADRIWFNGAIETLNPQNPRAEAIAIKNGRIQAVGKNQDILNLQGPDTITHNLHGRFMMPGLVESHTHALWGACRELFDVYVGYQASFSQLLDAVGERVRKLKAGSTVSGGPWRLDMRGQMGACPRLILDEISTVHPIILQDTTQHILWCNTLALQLAGITIVSPDLEKGVTERDPKTGAPNGILAEGAGASVRLLSQRTEDQLRTASQEFTRYFNSLGITAFKEPMAFEPDLKAYKAADERGDLTMHMAAHLVHSSPLTTKTIAFDELEKLRDQYASENLRTSYAKIFLDGVAPGHTASFIEPYLAQSGYDTASHDPDATLLMAPDLLNRTLIELDRRGFVTKMHAVGDNAVRKGLNATEAARKANGDSGLRHEISHAVFVSNADLPRFKALNAIAEISPKLWYPNPATAGQIAVLGRARAEKSHRIRDLIDAGAELICASDWPAAAPDANPWAGLAGMLSRQNWGGNYHGILGKDQIISLPEALPLLTINGARSLGMEQETGSLVAGKWADFIVLKDDISHQSPQDIWNTQVQQTFWKGKIVYSH